MIDGTVSVVTLLGSEEDNLKVSVSLEQSCFIQLELVFLFHISLSNQSV